MAQCSTRSCLGYEEGSVLPDDRLIVALDTPDVAAARALVQCLESSVSFFKIGLGLMANGGFELADELKHGTGKRVFLDLKLFDITTTIERAVTSLAWLAPDFVTVHGDPQVVQAACRAPRDPRTKILAVTVLTSLDRRDLDACLLREGTVEEIVLARALAAMEAGADGVIASPREVGMLRQRGLQDAVIVTPGVRPTGSNAAGQKRVTTPRQAICGGADHMVVGGPVLNAPDPVAAVRAILGEIAPLPQRR